MVEFDFYTPAGLNKAKNKPAVRTRIVHTIETDQLIADICAATTLTPADMKGALSALAHAVATQLAGGNTVHIDELGYLSPVVSGTVVNHTNDRLKLHNAHIGHIRFRPEKTLLCLLRNTSCRARQSIAITEKSPTPEQITKAIARLSKAVPFFTPAQLAQELGVNHNGIYKMLQRLEAAGTLHNVGTSRRKIYQCS